MAASVYTTSIASGAATASFDFRGNVTHSRYGMFKSTFSTQAELHLYGSVDGSNFYRMYKLPENTATTTLLGVTISSAMTGAWVEIPVYTRWLDVVASGAVNNGATITIAAWD